MNQPFRRFMPLNLDSFSVLLSLYAAVIVAIMGTLLLFMYQDIEVETSYKATLHQMFQVERAAAENRFLAQTTAALKSQADRTAKRFGVTVPVVTADLEAPPFKVELDQIEVPFPLSLFKGSVNRSGGFSREELAAMSVVAFGRAFPNRRLIGADSIVLHHKLDLYFE